MLNQQIERILLIEKFMNAVWNIGKATLGSGTAKSCRIMGEILEAIIIKAELAEGNSFYDHIPPKEKAKFPYLLVEELRQAGITWDDLDKINARRAANKKTVVYLAEKMLVRNFRDFSGMELHIWNVISSSQKSNYLSAEDIQIAKDANFIKIDLSGFFTKSRVDLFKNFFADTNLNAQQILNLSLPLSEKALNKLNDKLIHHKDIIESDFLRLKDNGITAAAAIEDMINIGKGLGSNYTHIRPAHYVINSGMDVTFVEYLSAKMLSVLGRKYKYQPFVTPVPAIPTPIPPKTEEELTKEKSVRDNAYQTLLLHFNLEPSDAKKTVNTSEVGTLRSLWHIKVNVMPNVTKVLEQMMEKFSGNVQMVIDLARFEQVIWSNETEAWLKYKIPVQRWSSSRKSLSSEVTTEQSDILLSLNKDLTVPLLKPLQHNLTMKYKVNHPDQEIIVGRDLEKFKEYTFIHSGKVVPEFMYDYSNVIAIINSTILTPNLADKDIRSEDFAFNDAPALSEQRGYTKANVVLAGDILILGMLLLVMLHHFKNPLNYWRQTLFGGKSSRNKKSKQDSKYALVPTDDTPELVEIKLKK